MIIQSPTISSSYISSSLAAVYRTQPHRSYQNQALPQVFGTLGDHSVVNRIITTEWSLDYQIPVSFPPIQSARGALLLESHVQCMIMFTGLYKKKQVDKNGEIYY